MKNSKPRVVKDYNKLEEAVQKQIKIAYPWGYYKHLISFVNASGKKVSALPFETDEKYYLVRMTIAEAKQIVDDDNDYTAEGILKKSIKLEYEDKYSDDDDDFKEDDDITPTDNEIDFDQIADED